jgi:hypothetical protein
MLPEHSRLITAAAKSILRPIGCFQKGRSRTWLDDHGWWVGVIEFQPSSWSRGSYLNVGACFLWYEKNYYSFDAGYRVEPFHEFQSADQFVPVADLLVKGAREEVLRLREQFSSVRGAAKHFQRMPTVSEWSHYYAGVSAGLNGDMRAAKDQLSAALALRNTIRRADDKHFNAWVESLLTVVNDVQEFQSALDLVVRRTRALLRLERTK